MQELDYALESVQDLRQKPSGKVSITLPHFMYQSYFRQIYPEFCRRYPDIQLEISVSDESINILNSGHDLGIRFGNLVEPGMVAHQLIPPGLEALFVSPDYLQRFGKPLTPEDLQQHKLVQYRFIASNQLAPLELNHNGQSIAVNMPCGLIVNDTNALIDGALNGLGVGRMLVPLVQEYLDDGRLIPVLQDYWPTYPGMYLYFLQNSQKARRVRVLIDFLLEKSRSG
ncbi:LysR substrate-binding domain-containing protein [Aliamphritea spongicola]|nr:LysR substrate-binding domain-containing protein [Aliamphritea spongicola]